MAQTYGNKDQKLKKAQLPDDGLIAAGRIIRAFAEIEDILNLWITKLAQTTEGMASILMGRTQLSTKLETVEFLAGLHGVKEKAIFKNLFGAGFDECMKCRNAMAHGVLLGITEDDARYAFLTSKNIGATGTKLAREVISYEIKDIQAFAEIAWNAIPIMEKALGLSASRQRHAKQTLSSHRKSQQPNAGGDKLPRQQKSSRGKAPKLSRRQQREARTQAARAAEPRAKKSVP